MKKITITCDHCGKDMIIDSSRPRSDGLILSCQNFGINTSGITYALAMEPLLDHDMYFCGFECLQLWLKRRYPERTK